MTVTGVDGPMPGWWRRNGVFLLTVAFAEPAGPPQAVVDGEQSRHRRATALVGDVTHLLTASGRALHAPLQGIDDVRAQFRRLR